MKKLLLLTLLVLFGCSKEDANENKFRELQQGNWWIETCSRCDDSFYINFSNQYLLKNVFIGGDYGNTAVNCSITPEGDFFEIEGEGERWELNNTVLKENSNEYSYSIRGESNTGDYFEEVHTFKLENNILTVTVGTYKSEYSLSQGPPGNQGVCEMNYFGF